MQHSILKLFKGDRVLWMVLMLLSVLSLLIVYSSTGALAYRVAHGNTMKYLFRQVVFFGCRDWSNFTYGKRFAHKALLKTRMVGFVGKYRIFTFFHCDARNIVCFFQRTYT